MQTTREVFSISTLASTAHAAQLKGFPMENGDETFASPTAAAAEFEQTLTNCGGADEGLTSTHPTKSYDGAEIDALRAAKHDLEEKLAAVGHENHFLAAETHRLEGLVSQARDEIATAEHAVASSEDEAASLRAEVKRLEDLLASEKSDHDAEMRKGAGLGAELQSAHQEKVALEEEIKALKASAATAAEKKEETAASSTVAPKEAEVASPGLVAAAAAGAAATAAIAVVFLHLKR